MIASLMLAPDNALPVVHRAIRDELQRGGTYTSVFITFAALFACVLLIYLVQRWYDVAHRPKDEISHPTRVFSELLSKLGFADPARELLTRIVRDRQIENPTAILISQELFDLHMSAWTGEHETDVAKVAKMRRAIFGDEDGAQR